MKRIFILSMCLLLYSVSYAGEFEVKVKQPKFKSKVELSGAGPTGITASTGTFAVVGGTGGIGSAITIPCNDNAFYVSIVSLTDIHLNQGGTINGLNGLQFHLTYDKTVVEPNNYTPTGISTPNDYIMGPVVNNNSQVGTPVFYDISPAGSLTEGKLYVGISYQSLPFVNGMIGAGTVISIKFKMLNSAAIPSGSYPANTIGIENILGTSTLTSAPFTALSTSNTLELTASTAPSLVQLRLWQNAVNLASGASPEPITDGTSTGSNIAPVTKVYLSNAGNCNYTSTSTFLSPDANGDISLPHTGTNSRIAIERDIEDINTVFTVISSTDALEVSKMIVSALTNTITFDIFMLIAADVNGDGQVTEGDKTDIFLRSIYSGPSPHVPGTLAAWRNITSGVPDWKFISSAHLADPNFILAPIGNAGISNVPSVSTCIDITTSTVAGCTSYNDESIEAVLVGDISNNWKTVNNVDARGNSSNNSQLLGFGLLASSKHDGLDKSRSSQGIYRMAISLDELASSTTGMMVDLNYLSENVEIDTIISNVSGLTLFYSDNKIGRAIISAGRTTGLPTCNSGTSGIEELIYIDIKTNNNYVPTVNDFSGTKTYLDEIETNPVWTIMCTVSTNQVNALSNIKIYPNPISDWVTVDYSAEQQAIKVIQLFDIQGKLLKDIPVNNAGISRINTADLANGIYVVRINNVFSQKVVKMN